MIDLNSTPDDGGDTFSETEFVDVLSSGHDGENLQTESISNEISETPENECEKTTKDSAFVRGDESYTDINQFKGCTFRTVEEAFNAYSTFAHDRGFSVRVQYEKIMGKENPMVRYMLYVCNKEGYRRNSSLNPLNKDATKATFIGESSRSKQRHIEETRVGCEAMISFKYDLKKKVYVVTRMSDVHTHPLQDYVTKHVLKSNRVILPQHELIAKVGDKAGLSVGDSFGLIKAMAGGTANVGFLKSDWKNLLNKNRMNAMREGDAHSLLEYLKEKQGKDPGFYYDLQVEGDYQIRSIFWSDGKMRSDYALYGDSVALDTTFNTNKNSRPLALFVGFNSHRRGCVFGASLLIDETQNSFSWVLTTFVKCMKGVHPQSIMTDQDPAIAAAIRNVIPSTYHGLCTWHILENAKKNLSKQYTKRFGELFNILVYKVMNEDHFMAYWTQMIDECFGGVPHRWLDGIYTLRKQWSAAWRRRHFTAGMRTTQISESTNATLKRYLQVDHNISQFFMHFDRAIEARRAEEAELQFKMVDRNMRSRYPLSSLLGSVASSYTPAVFDIFCKEYERSEKFDIKEIEAPSLLGSKSYELWNPNKEKDLNRTHNVTLCPGSESITCTCCKFQNCGILCRHALRTMQIVGPFLLYQFKTVPKKYILSRWCACTVAAPEKVSPLGGVTPTTFEDCYANLIATVMTAGMKLARDDDTYNKYMAHLNKFLTDEVGESSSTAQEKEDGMNDGSTYTLMSKARKFGRKRRMKSISEVVRTTKSKTDKRNKK